MTGAGAGAGGCKNELVARGGSGGAVPLSRAPVGGSASPAPTPLPQPAPSPAPAALPPPALPPPASHRQNGAHIPAVEGHAGTQIPARPVGAAGAKTPERPAAGKLQAGARATADSPTPAPPAPPAPSPLFPSHAAYQAHAALPDYRHTNHEARTEAAETAATAAPAPLDLHSHHHAASRPPHVSEPVAAAHPSLAGRAQQHSTPHPVLPGHDVRNAPNAPGPVSFSPHVAPSHPGLVAPPSSLPNQSSAGRPLSPNSQSSRSYPTSSIGSSHVISSISPSVHSHPVPYQNSSLHKHSVHPYSARPPRSSPFSVSNHIANHLPPTTNIQTSTASLVHPMGAQPTSLSMHLPTLNPGPPSHTSSLSAGPPPPSLPASHSTSLPNFSHSHKHPGLSLPPHHSSISGSILNPAHVSSNHMDSVPPSSAASATLVATTSAPGGLSLMPSAVESRLTTPHDASLPIKTESVTTSGTFIPNGYPLPPSAYAGNAYPSLYAPYATTLQHAPYLPPAAASPRNSTDTVSFVFVSYYCNIEE